MKKWFKKFWFNLKASFITIESNWQDDLIWCPSQCYYEFVRNGRVYCIYLRWRHSNPWTVDVIKDYSMMGNDAEQWVSLPVSYYTDKELEPLKKEAIELTKLYLAGYFAAEEAEQVAHWQSIKQRYGN